MGGEILRAEWWRFLHDNDKLEIIRSFGVDGVTVTQVAQRQEVRRQLIHASRNDLKGLSITIFYDRNKQPLYPSKSEISCCLVSVR